MEIDYLHAGPSEASADVGGGITLALVRTNPNASSLIVRGDEGRRVSLIGRSGPVRYGVMREASGDGCSFAVMRGGEYDVFLDGRVAATIRPLERHVLALGRP